MSAAIRRPTLDDAPALFELMSACDTAVIGRPDTTLTDVLDELREPGLDLEKDAWIAVDEHGAAAACVLVFHQGDGDIVEFDLYVRPSAPELAHPIWDLAERRAAEFGAAFGHAAIRVDVSLHRDDLPGREVAQARGFEHATVYYRMRIDHAEPIAPPQLPAGISLHEVGDAEHLRRAAVEISETSFADHFGFVPAGFDWWHAKLEASSTSGWDSTRVMSVDGVPAAVLIASSQYVEDDNCGYVDTLGVLKEFRGRGLGRLLLLDAFARDAADGRAGTLLHVDANNTTPALQLYHGVGMREDMVMDGWRKTVQVSGGS